MRNDIKLVLLGLLFSSHVFAGSDPAGRSKVNGYFLGYAHEAFIDADQSASYIAEFENLCRKRGKLWALNVRHSFACTDFKFIEEGGDGPEYRLELTSKNEIKKNDHALLFSTKAFPQADWKKRQASLLDTQDKILLTALQGKKYGAALKNLRAAKATVIDTRQGKNTIYIIPWRMGSDGIVDVPEFLIAYKQKNETYRITESRGRIVGYVDLDRDGVPELQISTNCDGICERVTSVRRPLPDMIEIMR